jgi:hypothetical protein
MKNLFVRSRGLRGSEPSALSGVAERDERTGNPAEHDEAGKGQFFRRNVALQRLGHMLRRNKLSLYGVIKFLEIGD